MGLVLFVGGPLDQIAYETETLLGAESLSIPVNDYVWTPEKRTGEKTGKTAQVWRYRNDVVPESEQPARSAVTTELRTAVAEASNADGVQPAYKPTQSVLSADSTETNAEVTTDTATSTPTSDAPVHVVPVTSGDLSGSALLERRKALKLSRAQLAELCGLAQSKIGGIENGTGKRVKPEEVQALADALTRAEQERSVGDAGGRE